jgi:23S rRNA (guanosine2251-2'-O)-methyltransferase
MENFPHEGRRRYTKAFYPMTRMRTIEGPLTLYGANAVIGLLRSGEPVQRVMVARGTRADDVAAAARQRGIAVAEVDRQELDRVVRGTQHQGIVAVAPPFRYAELEQLVDPSCRSALVRDGVQDPRNLGAILRTARAAGVGGVVLPKDRSVGITPVVAVASAGNLFGLRIARVPNLVRAMETLKQAGYWMIGLAADSKTSVFDLDVPNRPALVVGGEGDGLRQLVRRTCDYEVAIPMAPGVESLNVSVATGVVLFDVLRRAGTS